LPWVGAAAPAEQRSTSAEASPFELPDPYEPIGYAPPQWHRRIDPAVTRPSGPVGVWPQENAQRSEPTTFAAKIFSWHAALAPYAGLAAMFALVTCAGLLYWLAFRRPDAGAAATTVVDAPEWSADSTGAAPLTGGGSPLSLTTDDILQFTWSPPLAANAELLEPGPSPGAPSANETANPPLPGEPAAQATLESAEAVASTLVAPAQETAAPAPVEQAPAAQPPAEPFTSTTACPYPTTPYVSLDFAALLQAAAPSRSTESSPPATADTSASPAASLQTPR